MILDCGSLEAKVSNLFSDKDSHLAGPTAFLRQIRHLRFDQAL